MIKINSHSKNSSATIKEIKKTPFRFKYTGKSDSTTGLYVFAAYEQHLKSLFQQDKMNILFRETACLITRNPLGILLAFLDLQEVN